MTPPANTERYKNHRFPGEMVIMKWTRPLCGSAAMSQHACKTSESLEPQEASPLKPRSGVGLDLAPQGLPRGGLAAHGTLRGRQRLSCAQGLAWRAPLPPPRRGLAAGGGAPAGARRWHEPGQAGPRRAPQWVHPSVQAHTHERREAAAALWAARHRGRARLMGARSARPRAALAPPPPAGPRLRTLPGQGPGRAPARGAAVSDASACQPGRLGAAWLGRVPRHPAPGGLQGEVF
jgi:hypothetical protein